MIVAWSINSVISDCAGNAWIISESDYLTSLEFPDMDSHMRKPQCCIVLFMVNIYELHVDKFEFKKRKERYLGTYLRCG